MMYRIYGVGTDVHGDAYVSVIDERGAPVFLVSVRPSDERSVDEALVLARVAAKGPDMLELLRKIARPGYGLDLNDDVEYQAEYWAKECSRIKDLAREMVRKIEGEQ